MHDVDALLQVQAYRRKRLFRKKSSELVDPFLVIQIWDNNKLRKDKYIGQCLLNLLEFEEGLMDEDEMITVGYEKDPDRGCTCCAMCGRSAKLCWRTRCCTRMPRRRKNKLPMPRAPVSVQGWLLTCHDEQLDP